MKLDNFSFEEEIHKISLKLDPENEINDINIEDYGLKIRIHNVNGEYYIPIDHLEDLLSFYLKTSFKEFIKPFIKEMLNIYTINNKKENFNSKMLELCKLDQLNDHIFGLIQKRFAEIVKLEEESIFKKISMSSEKQDRPLIEECPFEKPWVPGNDVTDMLTNMYSANNFIDMQINQSQIEETDKKYMGRGRCRAKQVNIKDRPFVCEYPECKRAFKRFEHLKRHNKMHTGERPYKCKYPGCMKSFSRSDNLAQHFKIHNVSNKSQSLTFRNYYESNKNLD